MLTWIWLLFPFQSTLLIRGATVQEFRASGVYEFQSTLLIRGATAAASASAYKLLRFQSTLLIRGATLDGKARFRVAVISIHAPHTRSDVIVRDCFSTCRDISIHAPHTRSDIYRSQNPRHIPYFNPRSSYEERHDKVDVSGGKTISIHAPHTRSDETNLRACLSSYFNPRSSYEERQLHNRPRLRFCHFNPRSSYEERRGAFGWLSDLPWHFNPRSSYEERLDLYIMYAERAADFNPRSSYEERLKPR